MAHEGRPTDRSVSYEIEHGMIGALLMYGRTGLAIAQAEGWSPALCRRPQHEALAEWLAEGIEAGAVSDLNTALAHLALSPPTHRNAPGHSDALMMLCVAPQHAPILEAIPASVRAMAAAVAVERLAVLQAELRDAAGRGDMAAVGQIGKRIAALVAPPKAKAAKDAAPEESISGDDRPDPAAIAALKKIGRRGREDDRIRARVVFESDRRICGQIWYDSMRGRPMRGDRQFADHDDHDIALWLSEVYGIRMASRAVREVLAGISMANQRHPLRDYLAGLAWDGVPRISSWLQCGLSVEDSPLVRAIGRRWLIQAVARAMRPGCQADAALVLVGGQGKYKSSVVGALAGRVFFSESPIDLHGDMSDVVSLVHSAWIHDMSEGTDVRRADVDRLKQFITTRSDITRRKYGRNHEERHRSCVFTVTTNDNRFLPADPSGARRFWPVYCHQGDIAWMEANRDQLWAEAMVCFQGGEQWHLTDEERDQLLDHQQDYEQDDAVRGRVRRWLREPNVRSQYWTDGPRGGREPITTETVMTGPMGLSLNDIGKRTNEMRAGDILKKLGFTRRRIRTGADLDWAYAPGEAANDQLDA